MKMIETNGHSAVVIYAARTLQKCRQVHVSSSKSSPFLEDPTLYFILVSDCGDDILIMELAIDKVSRNGEIKLLLGEEEKEVSPCCLLHCLTNDGRLSIFHFARSPQSTDTSITEVTKIFPANAQSSETEKFSSEEVVKTTNQNQGANLEKSTSKTSVLVDAGRVNNFRTQQTQKVAKVKPRTISFSGNSLGNFSIPSIGPIAGTGSVMELPVKMALTGFSTASSNSSKLQISSKPGTPVSIGYFKQRAMAGAGSIESSPAFPSARLQSQKGFPSEPHFTRETYEAIPSNQFHDVSFILDEM
ncbi:hypothetical protein H5410_064351 [Solanum commersonii]|uniref:Uncharacterized protein n=1 Tax=Solanum commersonii TaxID=4109 RepID=A0A9J5VZJ6_SOLCO|nr:hypothetical protein H5410_064351 [Solanum commersonii]